MNESVQQRIDWLLTKLQTADAEIATHAEVVTQIKKCLAIEEDKHRFYRGNTERRMDDMAATIRVLTATPRGDSVEQA